tara:strand:+ start:69 stop:332 length:264 start_codon:yes stop_codon:yes gene_type:complete
MKEFKGTQGDWKIVKGSDSIWIESALWSIADVNKKDTLQEHIANAKLIAAAPKLLKALQDLLNIDEIDVHSTFKFQQNAQKAINEAL